MMNPLEDRSGQEFLQPTRQSASALLLVFAQLFFNFIRQYWLFFLLILFRPAQARGSFLGWLTLGVAVLVLARTLIAYLTTSFYIAEGTLYMESGLLQRRKLSIPLERIQAVNFQQTFLHRLFNAVKIEMDTSGSQGVEFMLTALDKAKAQRLREYILASRRTAAPMVEGTGPETREIPKNVLLELSLGDVLQIGITQNHLRTSGLILLAGFGLFSELSQTLGKEFDQAVASQVGSFYGQIGFIILALMLALIFLSFVLTLLLTVLRYYRMQFVQTGQGFQMNAGLLTRQEQNINLAKVQAASWSANPLQRRLGLFVLQVYQAGGFVAALNASLKAPGCRSGHVTQVLETCFPELQQYSWTLYRISPLFARRRFLFFGLLPMFALLLVAYVRGSLSMACFALALAGISYFWQARLWKSWSVRVNPVGIQLAHGFFTRRYEQTLWKKVQTVTLAQTPFQSRQQLCTLSLHTASATLEIPYIPIDLAHQIRNYQLAL